MPLPYSPVQWMNDQTQWPDIANPDIYMYLMESPGSVSLSVESLHNQPVNSQLLDPDQAEI